MWNGSLFCKYLNSNSACLLPVKIGIKQNRTNYFTLFIHKNDNNHFKKLYIIILDFETPLFQITFYSCVSKLLENGTESLTNAGSLQLKEEGEKIESLKHDKGIIVYLPIIRINHYCELTWILTYHTKRCIQ